MALPGVVASMITLTTTTAGIIGVIKRRCGACDTIAQLTGKCAVLVEKIRKLLKTLENSVQVPHDICSISGALDLRRDEFDEVLKNLEKMNRRTKRTHPIHRTEKFILAQGWAKKIEAIHDDLRHLRDGIETIVSSWGSAQFVVEKMEKIVTIDVTTKNESRWKECNPEIDGMGSRTMNYVDRMHMVMVKLTDANKAALHRYGNLETLSLPDALFQASTQFRSEYDTCGIQLIQRSAELLHPEANSLMASFCKSGNVPGIEKDHDQAALHYRLASSRGYIVAMFELMEYYEQRNDRRNMLKYIAMASDMPMGWWEWFQCLQFAVVYDSENTRLLEPIHDRNKSICAFQQSICQFFGLGRPKNHEKALDALQSIDFGLHSVQFWTSNSFFIERTTYGWLFSEFYARPEHNRYASAISRYTKFLMQNNQFLPSFVFHLSNQTYSSQKFKRYAFHAANNHCVEAHIILAQFFCGGEYERNEREMKRHLRIAADAKHPLAQTICRRLFGNQASMSKRVKPVQEKRNDIEGKERHRSHSKKSGKIKGNSHKK